MVETEPNSNDAEAIATEHESPIDDTLVAANDEYLANYTIGEDLPNFDDTILTEDGVVEIIPKSRDEAPESIENEMNQNSDEEEGFHINGNLRNDHVFSVA